MKLIFACLLISTLPFSADGQTYTIDTFAAGGLPPTPVTATSAGVQTGSIAVDAKGNVYFGSVNAVYKIDTTGNLTRVAGAPGGGSLGDGGPATSAHLVGALGVAVDSAGNLYIADEGNNRVRKVLPGGR